MFVLSCSFVYLTPILSYFLLFLMLLKLITFSAQLSLFAVHLQEFSIVSGLVTSSFPQCVRVYTCASTISFWGVNTGK